MGLFNWRAKDAGSPRTIDPAAYGYVPAAQLRADRAGPAPDFDVVDPLVATGNWPHLAGFLATIAMTSERRFAVLSRLGNAAAGNDGWLRQWLAADPRSVNALTVYAESLVSAAWDIRTSDRAQNVSREQWTGFFRVLRDVPDVCRRAIDIDPADPAPWIALQTGALGLQWSNDEYRALWSEISARAPHSFTATHRAWNYWRPRWFGSLELMENFLETAIAAAPVGSLLTMTRIQMLEEEFRPDGDEARQAFYAGERVNRALSAGIHDAAAGDPGHVKLPYLRHWLAYGLSRAGRNRESMNQFFAIGGYCGADPWSWYSDPADKFTSTRADVTLRWEDAGRP
ncbi:DUF4034 domain-containing protein [Dactylosporangium sp. NPDC049140]|uniref:DUF4034 domain-containing protein n=1 Tax=Dactylosporangium sp. NPDC049140 TaxID=3155647 RepID=UPI0033CF6AFD